eukprot:COSAG01_NODE_2602_length_7394_cov_2.281563_6_plen_66_part_00
MGGKCRSHSIISTYPRSSPHGAGGVPVLLLLHAALRTAVAGRDFSRPARLQSSTVHGTKFSVVYR